MRISQLISKIEDRAIKAAPALKRAMREVKIEAKARWLVAKAEHEAGKIVRAVERQERLALRNATQTAEEMEIANRALELITRRERK